MTTKNHDIGDILKTAATKYAGDVERAIAHHLFGEHLAGGDLSQDLTMAQHAEIAAIRDTAATSTPPPRMLGAGKPRRSAKARSRRAKKTPATTAVAGEGNAADPRLRQSKDALLALAKSRRVAVVGLKLAEKTKKEILAAIDAKK